MRALALSMLFALAACSASKKDETKFDPNASQGDGSSGSGGAEDGAAGSGGDEGGPVDAQDAPAPFVDVKVSDAAPTTCGAKSDEDKDKDGWSIDDGDCNDCDPNANPGAYDVPGNKVDEDCSGTPDDEEVDCDANIGVADPDPKNGARAIGLCRFTAASAQGKNKTWGVIDAKYTQADGSGTPNTLSYGILPNFGPYVNVQDGYAFTVLTSGTARRPSDPGYQEPGGASMGTTGPTPPGFPKDSPFCPNVQTSKTPVANDPAALDLTIRVPTNAKSFSFLFNFFTYEFPVYVCTSFNDSFVALLDSKAPNANAKDKNVSFDSQGNAISVNNALLEVCDPQTAGGKQFPCLLGAAQLVGTGYGKTAQSGQNHAATGWLQTTAPVVPGETIKMRFAVWDAGDHILASLVIVDAWTWKAEPATDSKTIPVPNPK